MKIKSLSDKELLEELTWAWINAMERKIEDRYINQPFEERKKEYDELKSIHQKYLDEVNRRNLKPEDEIVHHDNT